MCFVAEELPLKQGLKHAVALILIQYLFVAEELPLKQGLKQNYYHIQNFGNPVAEELPLKQGLKLYINLIIGTYENSRRGTSIKTRIETLIKRKFKF